MQGLSQLEQMVTQRKISPDHRVKLSPGDRGPQSNTPSHLVKVNSIAYLASMRCRIPETAIAFLHIWAPAERAVGVGSQIVSGQPLGNLPHHSSSVAISRQHAVTHNGGAG